MKTLPKTLKPAQLATFRRMLYMVGNELIATSKSERLPDQWDQLSHGSWTIAAIQAVYEHLRKEGMLP